MSAPSKEADLLALADEIDINRKIGADHRFSDDEATIIQQAPRLASIRPDGLGGAGERAALEQAKAALIKIRKCSIAGAEEGYGKPELWGEALFCSHGDVAAALKVIDAVLAASPLPADEQSFGNSRTAFEQILKHVTAQKRIASERLDNIEAICRNALASPLPAGSREEIARIINPVAFRTPDYAAPDDHMWRSCSQDTANRKAEVILALFSYPVTPRNGTASEGLVHRTGCAVTAAEDNTP